MFVAFRGRRHQKLYAHPPIGPLVSRAPPGGKPKCGRYGPCGYRGMMILLAAVGYLYLYYFFSALLILSVVLYCVTFAMEFACACDSRVVPGLGFVIQFYWIDRGLIGLLFLSMIAAWFVRGRAPRRRY